MAAANPTKLPATTMSEASTTGQRITQRTIRNERDRQRLGTLKSAKQLVLIKGDKAQDVEQKPESAVAEMERVLRGSWVG